MFNLPAAFASDKSAVLCKPLLYFMKDMGNIPVCPGTSLSLLLVRWCLFFLTSNLRECKEK